MIDDRIRVQSQLYPWILLSVLNRKKQGLGGAFKAGKPYPDRPVCVTSRDTGRAVIWDPVSAEVSLVNQPDPDVLKSGIGFAFADSRKTVSFFETGAINPLTMRHLHRLVSWKRLLQHLLTVQDELGSKNWERLSDERLLEKTLITLFSAVAGLNGLAQLDAFTSDLMHHLSKGLIHITTGGVEGEMATLGIDNGQLLWLDPDASLDGYSVDFTFRNIRTAWMCVANLTDNLAAVGKGDIKLRGYIPLADGFNHMLDRLQMFVKVG